MDCTLFTYRNLEELRKIQEEREVFAFIFGETKDMLDSCSDVCIDISALVYFLLSNKNNIELTAAPAAIRGTAKRGLRPYVTPVTTPAG